MREEPCKTVVRGLKRSRPGHRRKSPAGLREADNAAYLTRSILQISTTRRSSHPGSGMEAEILRRADCVAVGGKGTQELVEADTTSPAPSDKGLGSLQVASCGGKVVRDDTVLRPGALEAAGRRSGFLPVTRVGGAEGTYSEISTRVCVDEGTSMGPD